MVYKFPKQISLSKNEAIMAAMSGITRCAESVIEQNRSETHGSKRNTAWQRHVEGALGEFAVAKALGLFWPGVGIIFGPDIPTKTEVCQTEHEHGRLIIHDDAKDDHIFWLVTGLLGNYVVHGWILAEEGKDRHYWDDPQGDRPAYFVPQSYLNKEYSSEEVQALQTIIDQQTEALSQWETYANSLEAKLGIKKPKVA